MLTTQSEAKRLVAPLSFERLLEMQNLRPHPRQLNQNLHVTHIPVHMCFTALSSTAVGSEMS